MQPVRVLHITPSVRLLGARRSLLTLVTEIAGTRYEPVVLAPAAGPLTEELDKRRLPWIELRLPPWRKGWSWLSIPGRVSALREICARERIGLIHCNEIYPNPHAVAATGNRSVATELLGSLASKRRIGRAGIPIVTHMRLSVTPRMVRNYMLEEATRIIAVSDGAASDFDPFPWKQHKVRVVHNGIDFEEFDRARERRSTLRTGLGFTDDDFVIGQIGLLMPRKRPRFLIEAAAAIVRAVPRCRILFVGEASPGQEAYVEDLKRAAAELGITNEVVFLPFQRRIADFFAALDLHVLVSNDEGFGRVIIEAAAAGVPTIGSNVGGIPELIVEGETGHLLGDPDANDDEFWKEMPRFVELAVDLARNPERRCALGNAAREFAGRKFAARRYATGVMKVFDEALAESGATRDPW